MAIEITIAVITTSPVQNVAASDDPVGFFFLNGWPSHSEAGLQNVQPGWTVVGNPTWVVTAVGDGITNETITITGGTFLSGASYQFTGPGGMSISGGMIIA